MVWVGRVVQRRRPWLREIVADVVRVVWLDGIWASEVAFRGGAQHLEAAARVEDHWPAAGPESQVLAPEFDAEVARVATGAAHDRAVDDIAVELAVVGHASVADVARSDARPDVIDNHVLRVNVGELAGLVAEVEDEETIALCLVAEAVGQECDESLSKLVDDAVGEPGFFVEAPWGEDGH